MMECCGKKRNTRYCAQCGSRLSEHNLGSLLTHCQARLSQLRKEAERWKECARDHDENTPEKRVERIDRYIDQRTLGIAKWEAWAKALEDVMETDPPE